MGRDPPPIHGNALHWHLAFRVHTIGHTRREIPLGGVFPCFRTSPLRKEVFGLFRPWRADRRRISNLGVPMGASTPPGGEHLKLRDVTDAMRKMMAAIDSSNRVLRAITDVRGTALAILAPGGRFLSANSSAAAMFGYSIADLIGKSLVEMVRDSDQERVSEGFAGSASGAFHSFGAVLRGRAGREIDVLLHKQPIADSAGNFNAFLVVFEEPVILQNGSLEAPSRADSELRRLYTHL